jgi:hypothetical protein
MCKEDNYSAEFGNQRNDFAKFGNQNNDSAKLNNIFLKNMMLKDSKKYTKLIAEFSKTEQKQYTFTTFCDWLVERLK